MPFRKKRGRRRADEKSTREPTDEKMYTSEPLETDEGTIVIRQRNVGRENMRGGGEWPDPKTPPQSPAPGASR